MHVTYTPQLVDYMSKKGLCHIKVELADARTCCSGFSDISLDFVSEKGAQALAPKVVRRIQAPRGDVLVCARGLEYDDEVVFDLSSFMGLKDIRVKGIRAWSI